MGMNSEISWCDDTFNPWAGCFKVSPGCDNCYAETKSEMDGLKIWGPHADRTYYGDWHWGAPSDSETLARREGRRRRVFCGSMCDWAEGRKEQRPHLKRLWSVIERTPSLDWLLLTKRPGAIPACYPAEWLEIPRNNVWMGTTTERQEELDLRWPILRDIQAEVRWLSLEPLLGPIMLPDDFLALGNRAWCVVGGESGEHVRPMAQSWALRLRDQCVEAGVPFFFKQWGNWAPVPEGMSKGIRCTIDGQEMVRFPSKTAAGHLLDGRVWEEYPTTSAGPPPPIPRPRVAPKKGVPQ